MLPGQSGILAALAAALSARGFGDAKIGLQPIEPPRDWGVTSNVCFTLAGRAAQAEIAQRTAGLEKKEAKALAAEITREAGPKLAAEIATELNLRAGGTGVSPVSSHNGITGDDARATGSLDLIARVEAEGAYINFYYDPVALSWEIVSQAISGDYGKGAPTGKRIMVEYAQPNTHKDFHVGHLRNASIGQAIANLLEFEGNEVKHATYIGDVGAHVARAMCGQRFNAQERLTWLKAFIPKVMEALEYAKQTGGIDETLPPFRRLIELQKEFDQHSILTAVEQIDAVEYPLSFWGANYSACTNYLQSLWDFRNELDNIQSTISPPSQGFLTGFKHRVHELREQCIATLLPWLKDWEENPNGSARRSWRLSRDACVDAFEAIFNELEVTFDPDCWFFESTVDDTHLGQHTAQELKERGVAVVDDSEEYKGALYVDFAAHADDVRSGAGLQTRDGGPEGPPHYIFTDAEKKRIRQLGKMTILRSDGTSLYQTKELGLAKYKFDHFDIDESLYVVGSEQKLYFEQVFAILRLWGFPNAENCRHIAYELVVLPEGKMSSREGTVVSYRELRDEAVRRATEITREKGIVGDVKQTAHDIAIAAIKYAMLQVSGNQQIVFDFEQALSFDGRAAPYLQYAYARAGKLVAETQSPRAGGTGVIARDSFGEGSEVGSRNSDAAAVNAGGKPSSDSRLPTIDSFATGDDARATGYEISDLHPSEIALTRTLSLWPSKAKDAAQKYEPAVIANYLYELADAFNAFYRDCRVLDAPEEVKPWRQDLTAAFRAVMKTGFEILALPLPEAM